MESFVHQIALHQVVLLTCLLFSSVCGAGNDSLCPTWLHFSQDGDCVCGASLGGVIQCNDQTGNVSILTTYCLTSSDCDSTEEVVGSCLFQQNHGVESQINSREHVQVSRNLSVQDQKLCGYLNRQGQLCSQCNSNHYISAYSYDLKCHHCRHSFAVNTVLYITAAFVPLTLFLVAVLAFHVSVASPKLQLVVLICQMYSSSEALRVFVQNTRGNTIESVIPRILFSIYGIWNLDFMRLFIPPICLPLSTMQVIALDYLVAIYPLLLLICVYMLVNAHDSGFRVVVLAWRPFHWFNSRIRHQYNVKHSIIDGFATFIILSYLKLINVSVDLLMSTAVYSKDSSRVGYFLYYDTSMEFMSSDHLPYIFPAIGGILWGIMFPLMLLLYPVKCFQKFLNKIHLNRQGVRHFMQCFQGYYRDRTDGGWECRYYSTLYPIMRLVALVFYATTQNDAFCCLIILLVSLVVVILTVVRPYRKLHDTFNKVEAILLLSSVGVFASCLIYEFRFDWPQLPLGISVALMTLFGTVPAGYMILLVLKNMKKQFCSKFNMSSCYRYCKREKTSETQPLLAPIRNNA